jgi:hypothetical protein
MDNSHQDPDRDYITTLGMQQLSTLITKGGISILNNSGKFLARKYLPVSVA